jgi:hypothetical protein
MGYTSLLLKTGQTTKYVDGDDGDLKVGAARSFTVLDTGQYSGTTNVTMAGNTEAISNNCVQDNVTGLMWIRNETTAIGANPYGKGVYGTMPWTTDGDGNGVFAYKDAANAALLAGYGNDPNPLLNWRVPNDNEAASIIDLSISTLPTEFIGAGNFWTSSTFLGAITEAFLAALGLGITKTTKTVNATIFGLLVRGAPTAPPAGGNNLISGMVG